MEILVIAIIALVAIGAVARPFFRRGVRYDPHIDPVDPADASAHAFGDDALEAEIAAVREALRAGTVCRACAQANPAGSRFCAECGKPLAAS